MGQSAFEPGGMVKQALSLGGLFLGPAHLGGPAGAHIRRLSGIRVATILDGLAIGIPGDVESTGLGGLGHVYGGGAAIHVGDDGD